MPNRNLQKELERQLPSLTGKKLLLHSCCAPCSTYVLEYLAEHLAITIYFYNPNISPEKEYTNRLAQQVKLVNAMSPTYPIGLIQEDYRPEEFLSAIKGLEHEPEGGKRCQACFTLRLEHAAKKAKELGMDYFTTTLSISPHKDALLLDRLAEKAGEKYGIPHLPSDFKKRGGYQRSIVLSRKYDLYRQDYCGCAFSLRERQAQKEATTREN